MAKDKNSEAAKKVADAEKASKKKTAKNDGKPNVFVRAAKAVAKFFKDLRGETKKIVWPGAKMVVKSTGVVLATVIVLGAGIWIIDFAISGGISALNEAANATETTEVATDESSESSEEHDHDHDEEETTEETTAE